MSPLGAHRRLRSGGALTVLALVAFGVAVLAAPAGAAVTAQQVEEARRHLREVSARLEGEVALFEAAQLEEALLHERLNRIRVDLTARERELDLARAAARTRVAEMYIAAGSETTINLLGNGDQRAPARLAYLDSVALTDRELVNRLEQARRDFSRQQALLAETLVDQEQASRQLEQLVDGIYAELDAANQEYQAVKQAWDLQEAERIRREEEERIRREEERRLQEWLATSTTTTAPSGGATTTTGGPTPTTTAPSPPTTAPVVPPAPPGTMVCPVDGATTFRDSWGEPRPGGRAHTGVDMMSPRGTPLVAIENGVIYSPNWHYAGGIGLTIKGDSGDSWYYAHLDGYAAGIQAGTRVAAGQLVGYVGQTGNASVPHLHLAHILPSGQYVNPYPVVAALC